MSTTGQLVGAPINVSFDNHFQGEVGVGYSPASDKFLVAYRHFYEPAGPATIQTRTVNAADGALGTAADIDFVDQHQRRRRSPTTPRPTSSCVGWWQALPNSGHVHGRPMNPDGTAAAACRR